MDKHELIQKWLEEERVAHIKGWDFFAYPWKI